MATAHLIHGFLGVGKTAFARQLEERLPAIRFSHDEWMACLYGDDPPVERFAEFYRRVWEQMADVWPRCLELGLNVVLDFGFWTRPERNAMRAKITALGGQPCLYRLTCPEDEAWRRIEKRNADLRGSLYISRSTFEMLKGRFEPLGNDEERIEIGIRRAVYTDVSRIMAIRHSVRENRLADPNLVTAADCAAFIERSEMWVWEEDGAVQGFAAGDPRDGWIFALFVAPEYEGRGIGQVLLPLACETLRAAGYTVAKLSTVEGTRAERFYRANGWAMTGKSQKGELVFQKQL
jgi:predicted kinase/GNAT superfamily N-acetyltransferase